MRRFAWFVAVVSVVLAGWVFFFPVPLGWAARMGMARALPADGPLQVGLESATFRWRWGDSALSLEVIGLSATAGGRPLATWRGLIIEVPKAGLWQRRFAPAQITLRDPRVTLDQTSTGALALVAPPGAKPEATTSSAPPDLGPLAPVLPAPGGATKLILEGVIVQLRNGAGEVRLPFGRIETTLARLADGALALDLSLPLTAGLTSPHLTAHASLDPRTNRGEFAIALPAFATADLPVLPGAPPLPLHGTVALDLAGHYDLAALRLDDISGGFSVLDGDLTLPSDLLATKLDLEQIKLRGRADLRAQRFVLETGRVRIGALDVNVTEFEATLGDQIKARWQLEIGGLKGAAMRPLLPVAHRARVPLSDDAIDLVALDRFTTRGNAELERSAAGVWSSKNLEAEGRTELSLGREPFVAAWNARQAPGTDNIALDVSLPAFVPGRWPTALIAGTPVGVVDLPLAFSAQALLSRAGEPRSARLALTGGAGTLKPLQPGMPPLDVRQLEVRLESEQFDRAWRIPVARLGLTNGAGVELVDARAEYSPQQITAVGDLRATGLSGEFLALWLPPDAWKPLTTLNLPPREIALNRMSVRFDAKATALAAGGWQPASLAAKVDVQLRLHTANLGLAAQLTLPDAGSPIEATVDLAEFRPPQLGVVLPEGLTTAAFDFPVSLHAMARANLQGELAAAAIQLRAGSGRVKTPPAFGDLDLPLKGLALDAAYDPKRARAEVQALRLEAGGLRFDVSDVVTTIAPPYIATGRLELAAFALRPLLALWPASQQPELRRTVETTLRGGEFLGAQFDWGVKFDPAAQPALSISQLKGAARLAQIEAVTDAVPGPVAIASITAALDYPQATLELQDVTMPSAKLSAVRVQVSALDRPTPAASLAAKFETDLGVANTIWKFAPPEMLTGTVAGEFSAQVPFDVAAVEARVAFDFTKAKLQLPGFPNATPDTLTLNARVAQPLAKDVATKASFSLDTSAWLGAPVHLAGRATLTAGDHQPDSIEVTAYEHGRTRLQASFKQPSASRREISLTGPYLNLVPLLRAGLAAADALAARPVAPVAKTVAPVESTAPATMKIDVSVGEIEFGPGQNARKFELHSELDKNWPASLTLSAVSGIDDALRAELGGPAAHQTFKLTIADASGWMRTLAAPWSATPPAPGQFGSLVTQLMKVPTMVSGGSVTIEAEMRRSEPEWLRGRLQLTRATLIRPPYVLQLLALKSGKSFEKSPVIEEFSIGRLTLSPTTVGVTDISLIGSGLINNLKVKSASYGLTDEALKVDGEYFGVGFDVIGTRADPKIFLKDSNKLIRAIGTRNEFDFDNPTPKPKKP